MLKFLLILLIVFLFLRSVGKRFFPNVVRGNVKSAFNRGEKKGYVGDLVKDPQCGVYVSVTEAIKTVHNGEELYFCSKACKDKYLSKRSS